MKNIVGRLTVRHMLLNKKRTIVTIIGVIISVAMIMAVSTIAYSFTSYMGKNAMDKTGQFHVVFEKVKYENRNEVFEGKNIESSFYGKLEGDYPLSEIEWKKGNGTDNMNDTDNTDNEDDTDDKDENAVNRVFRLVGMDKSAFDKMYFGKITGSIPSKEGEIMLSAFYSSAFNMSEPGGTIELGGKSYTVTGIYDAMDFETKYLDIDGQITYCMFTYCDSGNIGEGDFINIYSMIYDLGRSIYGDVETIAEASGCETYMMNRDVLYYYGIGEGNFGHMMDTVKYVLIGVIVIGAIALISNGFSISLSERSKYLGMMASVGATKAQKRYSVFFEGFIVGIISIPLGILSGWLGTKVLFQVIEGRITTLLGDGSAPLTAEVKPWVVIVTVIFSAVTIFMSAYFPARRASRITPIDAIRQAKDIKIKSRQVKTSRFTRKLFGFEGELALKNLKRNKKRYAITLLSLIISIVLFLTVYGFVYYLTDSVDMAYDTVNYDMNGSIYNVDSETRLKIYDEINANKNIGKTAFVTYLNEMMVIVSGSDTEKYADASFKRFYKDVYESSDGGDLKNIELVISTYDKTYLKDYLSAVGVSYEEFIADKYNVIAVNNGSGRIYDDSGNPKLYEYSYLDVNEGTPVKLLVNKDENGYYDRMGYEGNDRTDYKDELSVNIVALLDDDTEQKEELLGEQSYYTKLQLIVTEELFNEMVDKAYADSEKETMPENYDFASNAFASNYFYIRGGEESKLFDSVYDIVQRNNGSMWGNSVYEFRKENDDMLFLIQVFTYGFITLMTLVCAANIFNTISTSVALRKREFATLRSVGMTKKSFNRMILFESGFYGIKALMYGMPLGICIVLYIYYSMKEVFDSGFSLPWSGIMIVIGAVFLLSGSSMMYASAKIKRENIIDGLKDENI